jgi:hypothetical protein
VQLHGLMTSVKKGDGKDGLTFAARGEARAVVVCCHRQRGDTVAVLHWGVVAPATAETPGEDWGWPDGAGAR